MNRPLEAKKRLVIVVIYLVLFLFLCEATSRLYWLIVAGVPFTKPNDIVFHFYPELRLVEESKIKTGGESFNVLLLGGSVLNNKLSDVEKLLLISLQPRVSKKLKIYNLAQPAHTSRDSLFKYRRLSDKNFDLVIFYHGINDLRTNNCPDNVFKADYSHFLWYKVINNLDTHKELPYLSCLFTIDYLSIVLKSKLGIDNYLSIASPEPEWLKYGSNIKSAGSFRANLDEIVNIANKKGDRLLLMTFVSFIPDNLWRQYINDPARDISKAGLGFIKKWGKPEDVVAGVNAHNEIIRQEAYIHKNLIFIDQEEIFPKEIKYFLDICHFTSAGADIFASNIIAAIPN